MDWKYLFTSIDGRINRAKFWAGTVVLIIVQMVAHLLDWVLGIQMHLADGLPVGVIGTLVSLVAIYATIVMHVKRWHDRGKSGWWELIVFVPVIGSIWMLVELGFLPGDRGPNRFGNDPLA